MLPVSPSVLVVGGGIAGTATALALRRAGMRPQIHEAHPTGAADLGAFLTIMPNGLRALAALDAAEPVEAVSFPARRTSVHDVTTGSTRQLPSGSGRGLRTLTRAALNRALQDAAVRRGIPIHHGKQLTSASTTRHGVRAAFSDGSAVETDLLVGADGIRSRVRRVLDPLAPEPERANLLVLYGVARNGPRREPERWDFYRSADHVLGCTTAPDGSTWWFLRADPAGVRGAPREPDEWRALAHRLTSGASTPGPRLVEASDRVLGVDVHHLPHVPTWHDGGRIVLVGDAVHAISPASAQGASLCAEDAAVLGQCLRDLPPSAAFSRYEQRRRDRVETIVAMGAGRAHPDLNPQDWDIDWEASP